MQILYVKVGAFSKYLDVHLTFASFKFPSLKCSAPTLLRISGGTSAFTFSFRRREAVPYACKAAWQMINSFNHQAVTPSLGSQVDNWLTH